jgi:hypothetical protein
MELFTATGKLYILPLPCDLAELKAWITAAVKNIDAPMVHHRTSLVVKKNLFSFPVTVNNSIKVDHLVFMLKMLLIMENITKCPIYSYA